MLSWSSPICSGLGMISISILRYFYCESLNIADLFYSLQAIENDRLFLSQSLQAF